jgi:predicted TIM-barrel fold metal-dependent hydrolase
LLPLPNDWESRVDQSLHLNFPLKDLSRRQFVGNVAAAAAGLAGWASQTCQAFQAPRPVLVDSHLHCFAGRHDSRFPYHENGPYRPEAAATPEHLLQCMDDAGVDFAIVVHPEPYQDDHRYLEHCLDIGRGRLKGTCLFFADRPDSLEKMGALVQRLPIVAARIHAYAPDRLPPFGKMELRAFWKKAGDLGLAVQLHFEPRHAPGFEPLIREFPAIRIIIDHLGRPFQGTPAEHDVVVRWARFPNTIMKLSAIPSAQTYPHRDPAPIIKRLSQEFGAERMIYGGGFGAEATGASYRAAFENARRHLADLPSGDQAKILGENATRLFGFQRT